MLLLLELFIEKPTLDGSQRHMHIPTAQRGAFDAHFDPCRATRIQECSKLGGALVLYELSDSEFEPLAVPCSYNPN